MGELSEQFSPNLNADAYRNLCPKNQTPLSDRKDWLEVIIVHKDGSLILGASNMIDRYWSGSIWFYNKLTDFDRNEYIAAIRTESGVRVASYLGKHDIFVVGEDSGLIQVFNFTELQELQCVGYSCQHDDSLTSISTFNDSDRIVTSGLDSCIKVWDTNTMVAIQTFNQAQSDIVTSVETQIGSDSVFLSTSMDSDSLLWDIRKEKPALGLWKKKYYGLTTSAWKCNDENVVAVGGANGSITILDIRNIGAKPLHDSVYFLRGVHKLLYNPNCPTQLAACCDATDIKVFDTSSNCINIFESSVHDDFVRGLAWHENELITCSWDNTILRHSINRKSSA